MLVYWPQMERTGAVKHEFRDTLERMMRIVEMEVMLCIAGDSNAQVGAGGRRMFL